MQNPAVNPSTGSLAKLLPKFPTRLTNTRQRLLRPIERRFLSQTFHGGEAVAAERMSGLDEEQLDELECRVSGLLEEPWDKEEGRPRELTLREALIVTCGYMRQNIIEDVWAEIFGVAQSTISRYITFLTPFVGRAKRRRPAGGGGRSRDDRERDRTGRRHALAVLVLGRPGQAVVGEVQDHRAWLADSHESSRQHNIRFRARYGQPARYGKAERISRRENPGEGRRRVRRQGLHRHRLHHHSYPQAGMPRALAMGTRVE